MKPVEETALFGGNAFTYILAYFQTNEALQWIEFILGVLTSIVLIGYRLWVWWTEAHKDGKITKEELKDGLDILVDGKKDVEDKIKKKGDKDGFSSKD